MLDRLLELICVLVLIGLVLAFGGVHPITYSLAEIVLFLGVLLLLVKQLRRGRIHLELPTWPVFFALWVTIQMIPLPSWVVAVLSPARVSGSGYENMTPGAITWMTISIDSHNTLVSLLQFLAYLSAFVLAAHLYESRKKSNLIVRALIILGCLEAGYGIFQYLTGWNKIFTYTNKFDAGNAFGTYVNRNDFAGLLEMVMPLILARALYSFEKRYEYARGGRGGAFPQRDSLNFQMVFYVVLLALMSVALVFSRSRAGILSALLSLIFVLLLAQVKLRRKSWLVLVVLFFTFVIGYATWIGLGPVLERFERVASPTLLEAQSRTAIWKGTVATIRDFPLTGTGLGTYGLAYRHYQTTVLAYYVDHAHNDYLEFAEGTGVVGLGLVFLPILYLVIRMVTSFLNSSHRYRRQTLLACIGSTSALLMHSLTDFNLHIPANAFVFAIVLGVGYKAACVEPKEDSRRTTSDRTVVASRLN